MEQITKQQVILIALLVAVITAIATSVATVSLLDNPGASSGQTIYKVIERSIETVANIPTVKDTSSAVKQITSSKELSPSDIAANASRSMIRIYERVNADKKFVALGAAVGAKNGVLASALLSEPTGFSSYLALTPEGKEIPAILVRTGLPGGLSFFTLSYDPSEKNKVAIIDFKNLASPKLGANVVGLGGKEGGNVVSTGIITQFAPLSGNNATSTDTMTTDMTLTSSLSGWLLFDISGNLVGLETGINADKAGEFVNANLVKSAIRDLL